MGRIWRFFGHVWRIIILTVVLTCIVIILQNGITASEAFGFGGESFGGGKTTSTPTPTPSPPPTPAPAPVPTGQSGVVDVNYQRCVDRDGRVTNPNNCRGTNGNYHWYYGGTGWNIGDSVADGSFSTAATNDTAMPPPAAAPTPPPAPELPFKMYNDTTTQTCVAEDGKKKGRVVEPDWCINEHPSYRWYYSPLRKGGKLFKIGEAVKGGSFSQPNKPPTAATPPPAISPPPVAATEYTAATPAPATKNKFGTEGVNYEFTHLTKGNQLRACVDDGVVVPIANCRVQTHPAWYYYEPIKSRVFLLGEKVSGGSFDPTDPAAGGGKNNAPDSQPPPAPTFQHLPEPEEPTPAIAEGAPPTRPLTPEDMEQIGRYASVAAAPIEAAAPQVWKSMVSRQYALAFSKPLWPLALAGIAFWWVFFIKQRWHIHDGSSDEEEIAYIICVYAVPALVTVVFGIIGLIQLSTSIARLIAPEYYAVQELIKVLAQHVK